MRVFDIDDDYAGTDVEPEQDQLVINGALQPGFLSGADNQWSINTFEFPLEMLLLPTAGNPTGRNDFEILIDIANGGSNVWAVEIDWAENVELMEAPIGDLLDANAAHHVNIVGHSKGGLDARLYAWDHPGKVANLIMIGTPNGGSLLADGLCTWTDIPFLLRLPLAPADLLLSRDYGDCDDASDALFQLRTDYVQDVFNRQILDRAGTRYSTIAGEWDGGLVSSWIVGPDDGIVEIDSVRYLADDHPDHPGKHTSLQPVLPTQHDALIHHDSDALPMSLCTLYEAQLCEGGAEGAATIASVEPPHHVIDTPTATIAAGSSADLPLNFEGATHATVIILAEDPTAVSATLPGASFVQSELWGVPHLGADLSAPADGTLRLDNASASDNDAIVIVAVASERSLTLTTTPSLGQPGSTVALGVAITEVDASDAPRASVVDATGTTVTEFDLTATSPTTWGGSFVPPAAGVYSIAAWADGGRPRFDTDVLTVSTGSAAIAGGFTESTVTGDDGLIETLAISPALDISTAGRYRLAGRLVDGTGAEVATAGGIGDLGTGRQALELRFDGRDIYASEQDGPYRVVDVVLSRDATTMALEHEAADLGQTAAYDHSTFTHFPIEFDLEGFGDEAVDTDADGTFDELRVTGSVRVDTAGSHAVNARLLAPDGTEVAEAQTMLSFIAGDNAFTLTFAGQSIADAGLDGPYTVADLSIYPTADAAALGYLITGHETAAYSAADFGAVPAEPTTERVSVSSSRAQANGHSEDAYMSDDGRYVVFHSVASNLVDADTNAVTDAFVYDRASGTTSRVSLSSSGAQASERSSDVAISPDGRVVTFRSEADTLVAGDTHTSGWDIFVHEPASGVTTLVSRSSAGAVGNASSGDPVLSADGGIVAFASGADNLVSGDSNGAWDIFVHDRDTGSTSRISVGSAGAQGNADSEDPAISADGRHVVFWSDASTLVSGDTNALRDIFVHDRDSGVTSRLSLSTSGVQANAASDNPSISADGTRVAFDSLATNLVAGDTAGKQDVFVRDLSAGTTVRISLDAAGVQGDRGSDAPSISANGSVVAFSSSARNLISGDTNNRDDIYTYTLASGVPERVSLTADGAQANDASSNPAISVDGTTVAFQSGASNLVADDTNGLADIFVRGAPWQ